MKKIIISCFVLLSFSCLNAQTTQSGNGASLSDDKVFTIVQQKPEFPGDVGKWLGDNIVYPQDAIKNNIQGTVYIQFIVEHDGSVSNVKLMRGIPGGSSLDNEALRVISSMPNWTPGMQNGHTVRVSYMLPIHFKLNDTAPAPAKQ
jgi:protein TonB